MRHYLLINVQGGAAHLETDKPLDPKALPEGVRAFVFASDEEGEVDIAEVSAHWTEPDPVEGYDSVDEAVEAVTG